MKSPFSPWGWAGLALFILGIVLIIIGSPAKVELIGSLCSIGGLIWVVVERGFTNIRREMRDMRQEMREGFEGLPKRIAEELRELLGR